MANTGEESLMSSGLPKVEMIVLQLAHDGLFDRFAHFGQHRVVRAGDDEFLRVGVVVRLPMCFEGDEELFVDIGHSPS